jgi:hypothetical protein
MELDNYFLSKHDYLGRYIEICDNITPILGYSKLELIGTLSYDLFNPNFIRDISKSHFNKNLTKVNYQIRSKSGHFVYVTTLSFKSLDDGNPNDYIYCPTRKMTPFEIINLEFNRILFKILKKLD